MAPRMQLQTQTLRRRGEPSGEGGFESAGEPSGELTCEKFSEARVVGSCVVTHPQITKQQSVNSAPSLRVTRNLALIVEVFLDVCTSVKLC
ncbi:MAG: hypothetical protein EB035_03580 [Actinobacteria bacterium]|nr:hypothetical protein [Actinomycetota bacterium]